jgi:glycosyltransferase involved in cell wall biosynthesis
VSAIFTLLRWLKSNTQDVINTHSSTDSWLVALATRLMKKRPAIVRTRHISAPISDTFSSRWLYTKSCDHIVTTGENLRQTLISTNHFPASHITSVRTGIDLDYFKAGDKELARERLGLNKDAFIIGIVATLRSWKGHRYLINAFKQFSNQSSLLLIVGDGPQWDALHELVNTLELQDRVIFTGRQNNIAEWLNTMDLFCLPSYANEGVPQALMQSQACGIPAVTTLIGSIDEAVVADETAVIVEAQNSKAILNALESLHHDQQRLASMAEKAQKNAKIHFSSKHMIGKMLNIFSNAITDNKL